MSLVQEQMHLERDMIKECLTRQTKENDTAVKRREVGDSKFGRTLVQRMVDLRRDDIPNAATVLECVELLMAPQRGPGKQAIARKLLRETGIEPELVAYISCKAVVNLLPVHGNALNKECISRTNLARQIAVRIHDEYRLRLFSQDKHRSNLLRVLMKSASQRGYPREWKKRTVKMAFQAREMEWDVWSDDEKQHIGQAILKYIVDCTGLLEPIKGETRYSPTDRFVELAGNTMKKQTEWFMLYRPMVVPPYDWNDGSISGKANLFRGGYITKEVRPYSIVKGAGYKDVDRFMNADWSKVLPAINALQRTKWRVNSQMVDALDWAFNEFSPRQICPKSGIGKMARSVPEELPELPDGYRTNEEVTRKHDHRVFLIHDRNRQAKSKRLMVLLTINAAKVYQRYDAIYFPHSLDSRGRAYPVPAILNPQGPDYVKALLEFSDGQPIVNQEAADWLAIAGANAYGNDKVSLSDRVQWTNDNEPMILRIAEDYTTNLEWIHVSEPFQFLRFCLEWAAFRSQGWGYVSHMVVPVDATCSGLQHYAAMLRDEVGGRSVNLVPGLPRQDIYGDVATVVHNKLHEDGSDPALAWIRFGINRKITKRQVMVVPYAGKFSSCLAYTREAVEEKVAEGADLGFDMSDTQEYLSRTGLLAKYIWEAISEVVVRGKQGMDWLTQVAKAHAKWANAQTVEDLYDRRMEWTTTDGFPVVHFRDDSDKYKLETKLDGVRFTVVLYRSNGKLSSKDMGLAVAPNFVHALDACLMRATVIKALDLGITSFGMVHDSFGTHAASMSRFLEEAIKPSFVEMYEEHDVLSNFAQTFPHLELPEVPAKGSLDLQGVLRSEFFFS